MLERGTEGRHRAVPPLALCCWVRDGSSERDDVAGERVLTGAPVRRWRGQPDRCRWVGLQPADASVEPEAVEDIGHAVGVQSGWQAGSVGHLEVQVWFGGVTGVADLADGLPGPDSVARPDLHAARPQVGVQGEVTSADALKHEVAGQVVYSGVGGWIGWGVLGHPVAYRQHAAGRDRCDLGAEDEVALVSCRVTGVRAELVIALHNVNRVALGQAPLAVHAEQRPAVCERNVTAAEDGQIAARQRRTQRWRLPSVDIGLGADQGGLGVVGAHRHRKAVVEAGRRLRTWCQAYVEKQEPEAARWQRPGERAVGAEHPAFDRRPVERGQDVPMVHLHLVQPYRPLRFVAHQDLVDQVRSTISAGHGPRRRQDLGDQLGRTLRPGRGRRHRHVGHGQ